MPDPEETFERQRRWQKARATLSWAEKVRMAERIRESARALRATAVSPPESPEPQSPRR